MKTRLIRFLALLLLGGLGDLVAQTPGAADPAKFGLTQASLREIDAVMSRYMTPDRFPGAVLLLARRDTIGYWKAFGVRDLYTWFDRDRDLIGLVWAQAVPYQVYPLFEDVRRVVAAAIDRATRRPEGAGLR